MKKTPFRHLLVLVAILGIGLFICGKTPVMASSNQEITIQVQYQQKTARDILPLINKFRTGSDAWAYNASGQKVYYNNLKALKYDYELEKVAMLRAAEIALYFDHTRPNGKRCFTAYEDLGVKYKSAGENIAAGYATYETAASVFEGWLETNLPYSGQGHRRNMLNSNFTAIGVGHVIYNGSHYWVQEFRDPAGKVAETVAMEKDSNVKIKINMSNAKLDIFSAEDIRVMLLNESVELPYVQASISFDKTWPKGNCPVNAKAEWSVSDSSILQILDGNVIALKAGNATLTGKIMGKTVKIPVSVVGDSSGIDLWEEEVYDPWAEEPEVVLPNITGFVAKSNGYDSVKLSWNMEPSALGYEIYRATNKSDEYALVATVANNATTSYVDKKLTCGKTYYYRVRAISNINGINVYSQDYSAIVAGRPVLSNVSLDSVSNSASKTATIKWKKVSGASGYEVYSSTSKSGKYTKIATIKKGDTVTYKNTKLSKGKTYYYKVRAYRTVNKKNIYSSYSGVKSVKISK